jgi:hypothetical protein
MYNEEFLAPFFLSNYAWARRVTILYDLDSTDRTREIIEAAPNTRVIPIRFPDGLNDSIKAELVSRIYGGTACDWALIVDADEFVFYKEGKELRPDLEGFIATRPGYELFKVNLFQVYRHRTDQDLDPALPPAPQRRHGEADMTKGFNPLYIKPILARAGLGLYWKAGCHAIRGGEAAYKICPETLPGAHWAMADPCFCLERKLKNRVPRLSRHNLQSGMSWHYKGQNAKKLVEECSAHRDDPLLF